MNIVCCVKHVPDTNTQIQLAPDRKSIAGGSINYVMSPYDEFALEEALRIREKNPDTTVTVVTLGPERSDQVLRTALAMGAGDAIHILDEKNHVIDPLIVSQCLAKVIKEGAYDLVFCGRQAVDDDAFQVGGALASLLGFGLAALASKVTVDAGSKTVTAEKILEGGVKQTIRGKIPLVITAQKGLNEPRFASLPGIMKAKSKSVKKLNVEDLGIDLTPRMVIEEMEIPKYNRKKRIILAGREKPEAVKELISLLRTEAKIID